MSNAPSASALEQVPVISRDIVARLIVQECTTHACYPVPCDLPLAYRVIDVLTDGVEVCRRGGGVYFFTPEEMNGDGQGVRGIHQVLDTIMVDDTFPTTPDGAHAGLNALILGGNEIGSSLVHTRRDRDGEAGIPYCAMFVALAVVGRPETVSA